MDARSSLSISLIGKQLTIKYLKKKNTDILSFKLNFSLVGCKLEKNKFAHSHGQFNLEKSRNIHLYVFAILKILNLNSTRTLPGVSKTFVI